MKAVLNQRVSGIEYTVLVETMPDSDAKGYVSYFISGEQVNDWSVLSSKIQNLFSSMSDRLCEENNLIKWSY